MRGLPSLLPIPPQTTPVGEEDAILAVRKASADRVFRAVGFDAATSSEMVKIVYAKPGESDMQTPKSISQPLLPTPVRTAVPKPGEPTLVFPVYRPDGSAFLARDTTLLAGANAVAKMFLDKSTPPALHRDILTMFPDLERAVAAGPGAYGLRTAGIEAQRMAAASSLGQRPSPSCS